MSEKISILDLQKKKRDGQPITMITAYDYPSAQLVDAAGADMILVGDSVAMTVLGHKDTTAVTVDEMLHHCRAVARGAQRPFLVGDLPFGSYQVDEKEAVRNAVRFIKEAGMDCVKMEGGGHLVETARSIVEAGVAVMGHLGLTPQTATLLGGFRVQAKTTQAAQRLIDDAFALQEAGCFALVLEAIPSPVATAVSQQLTIPTIGIGAGSGCDGQVLVFHDMLGLFAGFKPKFVKRYAELREPMIAALHTFVDEVEARAFPDDAHSYSASDIDFGQLLYGGRS